MSRAQLKHVLLDVDFFNNPKIEALGFRFGSCAQACLIEILCSMSRATNAQVDEDLIRSKIGKHRIADADGFFAYIIEKRIIFKEGEAYSNAPVIEDQEKYARKLGSGNARVTRYREKKDALQTQGETHFPDIDIDTDYDLDLNKLEIAFPEFLDPKITSALSRWRQHRAMIGKPFDQMALDSLQSLYTGRANELADDIDHSISNGWKTLNAKPRQASAKDKISPAKALALKYASEGI